MRWEAIIYYALGFTYMLLAGELFYLVFKIDEYTTATVFMWPTMLIVIGLTLIGSGIMLIADPGEYSLAKLLSLSGLITTLGGIGVGIEYAARFVYLKQEPIVVLPIYVSTQVPMSTGMKINLFNGSIFLFLAILPAATFIISEYGRLMSTAVILLNVSLPSLTILSVILMIPGVKVLASIAAIIEFLSITSLVILDAYRALRTIPAE